jgi:hypothetical protein
MEISFGQIAIFNSDLQDPFNDWTDEHVRQGFSWRPGSVSFSVLSSSGSMCIDVFLRAPDCFSEAAQRVISVPMVVNEAGLVEISGISQGQVIQLAAGTYKLIFEHGVSLDGDMMWCGLYFVPSEENIVIAEILRGELAGTSPLLMEARAALP